MKKIAHYIIPLVCLVVLSGCEYAPTITRPPFTNTADIQNVDFSKIDQMKHGMSCATTILYLLGPFGQENIVKTTKDAGISKIELMDYDDKNYILWQKYCIHVYGY